MRIATRLILGFLAVSVLVVLVAFFGIKGMSDLGDQLDKVSEETIPVIEVLEDVRFSGLRIVTSTSEFGFIHAEKQAAGGEIAEEEEEERLIQAGKELFARSLKKYEDLVNKYSPSEKELSEKVRRTGQILQDASSSLLSLKRQGVSGKKILDVKEVFEEREKSFLEAVSLALAHAEEKFAEGKKKAQWVAINSFRVMILVGFLTFALSIAIGLFISRSIANPIARLRDGAVKISKGNMDARVEVKSEDEIGELAASFNIMTAELRKRTQKLSQALAQLEETNKKIREQQTQLLQAQKMESLGRLTGGIAHDFNNLLGIITGYCELSLMGLQADDPLRENLREIKEAGERADTLTRQLLAFSRKQILEPKVLNMNNVLSQMDRLLRRLIGEDVSLVTVPDPELGQVKADPGQMEQVILNLALNARDAMPQGGKLTLETKNVTLDQAYADQHLEVRTGPYVMVAVSDTGQGMDAKVMAQIFEPFFTTKERGKGTGLGLATAYGIVKQSGGHLSVYSEPGRGASFKIYLPRVEEAVEDFSSSQAPFASSKGWETVLVVEDEERLRKLVCQMLKNKGYAVLEASSGQEALQVSESYEGVIALLVTDVIMPGFSGPDTAARLKSKRPEIKVLYISGYTDNAIVHHGILKEGIHFLQKPFTPEVLARKVREVLGSG